MWREGLRGGRLPALCRLSAPESAAALPPPPGALRAATPGPPSRTPRAPPRPARPRCGSRRGQEERGCHAGGRPQGAGRLSAARGRSSRSREPPGGGERRAGHAIRSARCSTGASGRRGWERAPPPPRDPCSTSGRTVSAPPAPVAPRGARRYGADRRGAAERRWAGRETSAAAGRGDAALRVGRNGSAGTRRNAACGAAVRGCGGGSWSGAARGRRRGTGMCGGAGKRRGRPSGTGSCRRGGVRPRLSALPLRRRGVPRPTARSVKRRAAPGAPRSAGLPLVIPTAREAGPAAVLHVRPRWLRGMLRCVPQRLVVDAGRQRERRAVQVAACKLGALPRRSDSAVL